MILNNNPSVDAEEVNARVYDLRSRGYRPTIAAELARPDVPVPRESSAGPVRGGAARRFIRSIPLVGAMVAWAYRRWRIASAPAMTFRERVRTVPGVGRALRTGWAVLDAPRFRAESGAALEFLRSELDLALARIARLEDHLRRQTRALILFEQRHEALAARVTAVAPGKAGPSPNLDLAAAPPGDFYGSFEAHFRGTGDSIRERLLPYLERVRRAVAECAAPRCVDIGCGSGEWLRLLAEHGIAAQGFDLDVATVQAGVDAGRNVRMGDGISWLESQPPGSVDVVTAFQVIEHLPFERFVQLIDATYRALSPNGIAIFETPNPENLQVGACNFHYDPTHRQPIPPPVAEFLAKRQGFPTVEIVRLNPYPESQWLPGEGELVERLNRLLYGPQDYALVMRMRRG